MSIHLKLNLGGQGTAPSVPSDWTNVWGVPVNLSDLQFDKDFGDVGSGVGLRTINNDDPNTWGVNNNTSAFDLGQETGDNSGVYPDAVLKHGWFTKSRLGKIELYNNTGTPLTGKTFTVRLLGSRDSTGLTPPRTTLYTVNGGSGSLDVIGNIQFFVEFTGVTLVNGVITITTTNTTPSDTDFGYLNAIEVAEEVSRLHLKLNLGGWGTQPPAPTGWANVWGVPVNTSDLNADIDFGNIGGGVGMRTINDGSPNHWGINNNTGAHDLGEVTGGNSGVYPDSVLKHGWFTNDRTGKIELYNHTGTPLNGKTFTIRLLGSRKDLAQPRTSLYTVHGNSISQDVDDNISQIAVFSGVSLVNNVITIIVTDTTPTDLPFAYLNAIEIEEEAEQTVRNIVSVENPQAKNVIFGTPFDELELPSQVTVELDDQSNRQINVEWQVGNYDPQTAGVYNLTGNLVNLPAGVTNSQNLTASISVTVEAQTGGINLKLNIGGLGTAPSVPGWRNVWGQPYTDSNLLLDKDFGNVGSGIGLICINNGDPNAWGENQNTALHNLGKSTGNNSGVYPDNVLRHGWFTNNNRIGKIELYNHTGTPLSNRTFTIRLCASRRDLTQPRTTVYTVNGISKSLDVDDNTQNVAQFTNVSAVNGKITITTTNGTPSDMPTGYLNAIEIIEEGTSGPRASELYFTKYPVDTIPANDKHVLVYLPNAYDENVAYPVIFYYHGEGGKGAPEDMAENIATGDGVQTVFGGNFDTPGSIKVLYTSVVIKVDGNEVARAKTSTIIEGLGITGEMSPQVQNGSYSITFEEPPALGAVISIAYKRSKLFETGLAEFLNRGDQPPGVIILCPQLSTLVTDFNHVNEFQKLKEFAVSEFNVNTNRIYITGLSRGARGCRLIMIDRYAEIAAVIALATPDYTGFSTAWPNFTNLGTMFIMGTIDSYKDEQYLILSIAGGLSLNIYPRTRNIWGVGHTNAVWNTQCYNRKERTDAKGTANFDYVRWLKKHSLNLAERARLFVEYAEYPKPDGVSASGYNAIEDYREALILVNLMSASSEKTTLLNRLEKLKSDIIDKGGRRFLLDLGISTATTTGYNNLSNHASGQSIASLVDDEGVSSTYGFSVVTQAVASNQQAAIASNRGNATYFGFPRTVNHDGCTLSLGTGVYKFTGLNTGKTYSLRFHHNEGSADFAALAQISIKIGTVTKTQYSAGNTLEYVEFLNVSPSGSGEIVFEAKRANDRDTFLTAIELFQNP